MAQKNIYELLNDVETDFTEYPKIQTLSDTELTKLKKNVTWNIHRKKRWCTFAAAACTALFFSAFVIHPFSGAASETEVGYVSPYPTIQSYLGTDKDVTAYEQIICQNDINKGISMSVDRVILDDHTLFISVGTDCKEHAFFWPSASITINGQKKEYRSADIAGSGSTTQTGQLMIMEYELDPVVNPKEPLDIQLSLYGTGEDETERQWDFSFTVSGEQTADNTTIIPLDYTFTLPDGNNIRLTRLQCNDLRQIIYYESDHETEDSTGTSNWYLEGIDNQGNTILFTNNYSDSKGGFLQLNAVESKFSDQASALTLQPFFSRQKPLSKDASPEQKILQQIGKVFPEDWTRTSLGESFTVNLSQTK